MPPKSQRVTFQSAQGTDLVGLLDQPEGRVRAYALFAHCFTCSKDLKAVRWFSRELRQRGIAVLRFDFTGLGESGGEFADSTFSSNLEDLVAAADFLRREYEAPRILVGHSLGGAAVLAAAEQMQEAVAVATIAAPSDTNHLRNILLDAAVTEAGTGEGTEVSLAGRRFRVAQKLLDDLSEDHLGDRLRHLKKALLILHSPVDEIVGIDHARRIYEAALHPKSFVSLDDADHLLTREADARYAAGVLAAWVDRYLPELDTEEEAEPETRRDRGGSGLGKGDVLVAGTGADFKQEVLTQHHRLTADEPKSVPGGTDLGPNPYELLLAALGTCTSMTLGMYARHKELPLESVRVKLHHSRVHAEDCMDCESKSGRVDRIERTISLEGDLTEEQRQRMLQIADRCPVHKTLKGEIEIRSELEEV